MPMKAPLKPDSLAFAKEFFSRREPDVLAVLRRSSVGIAGAGGLGSNVAVSLARAGVGRLVIADFDQVEPSNLNRQQYFIDQIGIAKVEALRQNLLRINPYVTVVTHRVRLDPDNLEPTFRGARVVVEAFDRAEEKAMLINTVSEKMPDTFIVAASGVAGYGENNEIQTIRFSSKIFIIGDQKTSARPGTGLMAPRVGIAAHHQANTVLRILLGEET
jgi:sulfur carrier protein ThiS adenylyltransferase